MNKPPIIFLDIDGTMNNFREKVSLYSGIEASCAQALKRIIEETEADLVISSVWRLGNLDELARAFDYYGIERWIDVTAEIDKRPWDREHEILDWVCRHRPDRWIALDDEDNWGLYPRNFRIPGYTGLTEKIADQAIKFLKLTPEQVSKRQRIVNQHYHETGVMCGVWINGQYYEINPVEPPKHWPLGG